MASVLMVGLQSGEVLRLQRIGLFPRPQVQEIALLRSDAAAEMAKCGSNAIFAMGSPGVVAAELIAFSLLNSVSASSAQKRAGALIEKAAFLQKDLAGRQRYFEIGDIVGVGTPKPADWRAQYGQVKKIVHFADYKRPDLDRILAANDLKPGRFQTAATVNVPVDYCHDGDVFIFGEDTSGTVRFRWDNVCSYRISIADEEVAANAAE